MGWGQGQMSQRGVEGCGKAKVQSLKNVDPVCADIAMANIRRKVLICVVHEDRRRVLIAASILAAGKLAQYDTGKRVPA